MSHAHTLLANGTGEGVLAALILSRAVVIAVILGVLLIVRDRGESQTSPPASGGTSATDKDVPQAR